MAKCVVRHMPRLLLRHIPRLLPHSGAHINITTATNLRCARYGFHRSSNILSDIAVSEEQCGWNNTPVITSIDPAAGLNEEQIQIQRMVKDFATKELLPSMSKWDQQQIFPVETLRRAAELGFGAIYTKPDYGGTGLSRLDASIIFEGLSEGCVSTTAYISIHK